jgi:hypothetical protein
MPPSARSQCVITENFKKGLQTLFELLPRWTSPPESEGDRAGESRIAGIGSAVFLLFKGDILR